MSPNCRQVKFGEIMMKTDLPADLFAVASAKGEALAKGETPQHTTQAKSPTKSLPLLITPKTILETWRENGKTKEWIYNMCEYELEWAAKDDSISFTAFYKIYGLCRQTYDKLRLKHKILDATHKVAKEWVGERREKLALTRKYDPLTIHKTLRNYEPEWREIYDEDMKNKKEQAAAESHNCKEYHAPRPFDEKNKPKKNE